MGHKPAASPLDFARAVNAEIRAEMGKSDEYRSNRGLAAALGVSGDYVNRRVNNEVSWDLTDVQRIAELFDLEPSELVDRALAAIDAKGNAKVIDIRDRKPSDAADNVAPVRHERTAASRRKNRVEDEPEITP